ncbi:ferritin-like domain-containing protein [Clostridium thailandense]|uniref:Manganese catalase family protein n=1 Tax=Clostridium thailandense TaxID=2794346 RepID=A0A949TYH4_9CLOT|nr:ferritin-like domain-containing protein [Clostridium thailandense]MBV7274943.1 manganese catalase family protein [Clostridium thailandense]
MPEDLTRHNSFSANSHYPEPKIECKNINYANILLQDYAGTVSELTASCLYVFQHIVSEDRYKDYSKLIKGISIVEMKHLHLLGETIKLLGVKPVYTNSVYPCGQLWSAAYVNYTDRILDMILEDIKSEKQAIRNYEKDMCLINDKYIRKLLERIIEDEKVHLKLFKEMYKEYSK